MTNIKELQIKNVSFGIPDCGGAIGQRTFYITFAEEVFPSPISLWEQLEKKIDEAGLKNYLVPALDGSQSIFWTFQGGLIEKKEYKDQWVQFYKDMSSESIKLQKLARPDQLRPPFMIWTGSPLYFSGLTEFYQSFNVCYAIIKYNKEQLSPINNMALTEILNHQQGYAIVETKEPFSIDVALLKRTRKTFIRHTGTNVEETIKWCIDNNFRYNHSIKKTDNLIVYQAAKKID